MTLTQAEGISGAGARVEEPTAPCVSGAMSDNAESVGQGITSAERPLASSAASDQVAAMPSVAQKAELLLECERIIDDGLDKAMAVGAALSIIEGRGLYPDRTFAAYVDRRWGLRVRQAYRLMAHHKTLRAINGLAEGDPDRFLITAPESQTRPFLGLPLEDRAAAWREAVASAPGGVMTAKHGAKVVGLWKAKLGMAEPSPKSNPESFRGQSPTPKAFGAEEAEGKPGIKVRDDQLKEIAETTIKNVRLLVDVIGTADSGHAANVTVALELLEGYREHLGRCDRLQAGRLA